MIKFKVLKVDGPNLVTDKGCVQLCTFQYADGGKSKPVELADWREMRDQFIASPALIEALEEVDAGLQRYVEHWGDNGRKLAALRQIIDTTLEQVKD